MHGAHASLHFRDMIAKQVGCRNTYVGRLVVPQLAVGQSRHGHDRVSCPSRRCPGIGGVAYASRRNSDPVPPQRDRPHRSHALQGMQTAGAAGRRGCLAEPVAQQKPSARLMAAAVHASAGKSGVSVLREETRRSCPRSKPRFAYPPRPPDPLPGKFCITATTWATNAGSTVAASLLAAPMPRINSACRCGVTVP